MGLAEREAEMQELETSRPGRSRDLFGVQLEVIASKILFASLTFNQKFLRWKIIFTNSNLFLKSPRRKYLQFQPFISFLSLDYLVHCYRRENHEKSRENIGIRYDFSMKIPLKNFLFVERNQISDLVSLSETNSIRNR